MATCNIIASYCSQSDDLKTLLLKASSDTSWQYLSRLKRILFTKISQHVNKGSRGVSERKFRVYTKLGLKKLSATYCTLFKTPLKLFSPSRSFVGHINEKNFVGLATDGDYITCGSENNSLYVYYRGLSKPLFRWENFCIFF